MLPLSLLRTAQNHPMLVELKNGETYNGHLVSCDNWMNINLREVSVASVFHPLISLILRSSAQAGTETSSGGCLSATLGDPTSSTSGRKQTVVNIIENLLKYVHSGSLMR